VETFGFILLMIAIGVLGCTATDWIFFRWSQLPIVPAAAAGS
jgi:hypothetical protein